MKAKAVRRDQWTRAIFALPWRQAPQLWRPFLGTRMVFVVYQVLIIICEYDIIIYIYVFILYIHLGGGLNTFLEDIWKHYNSMNGAEFYETLSIFEYQVKLDYTRYVPGNSMQNCHE